MENKIFKKDLHLRELMSLVASNETGHNYEFNNEKTNELKYLLSFFTRIVNDLVLYRVNNEIIQYKIDKGIMKYITCFDISEHLNARIANTDVINDEVVFIINTKNFTIFNYISTNGNKVMLEMTKKDMNRLDISIDNTNGDVYYKLIDDVSTKVARKYKKDDKVIMDLIVREVTFSKNRILEESKLYGITKAFTFE